MAIEPDEDAGWVKFADIETLRESGSLQKSVAGRTLAAFWHDEQPFVVDSRCPHMGFPLAEGSVDDGILTCHWHHARFELSCGDTFDPWADDVPTYPAAVHDGEVWVDPDPPREVPPAEHWTTRLDVGMRENLDLVIAKAVVGLDDAGVPPAMPLRIGAEFGTQYRDAGWGSGLTILVAMANIAPDLRPADRRRARYTGLRNVAGDCAGEPPFFAQSPFSARDLSVARLDEWFRRNIEVRDRDGAERVLRTAIRADHDESTIAALLFGAATDHLYLDSGHRLDFINKAFELLDHIGWDNAEMVLPSLVPGLASADRAEEGSAWRQPIDIAELLFDAYEELPDAIPQASWTEPPDLVETLLDDDPDAIVEALTAAVASGASPEPLAGCVAHAAARRVVQFGTGNEFADWNTVHHTFSYANAVHMATRRTDRPRLYRGVFDAAMSVYLDRFLNTPPAPIPDPAGNRDPEAVLGELLETFEVEGPDEVNRAGRLAAEYLAADGDVGVFKRTVGQALLREDAGFHTLQSVEAGFRQHALQEDSGRARLALVAPARYLAAHTPTRREAEQTFRIAERLNRGEAIHEG